MGFSKISKAYASYVAPTRCLLCDRLLEDQEELLCTMCISHLTPSVHKDDSHSATARLFWGQASIEKAGVLWVYQADSPIAQLLIDIKYRHQAALCQHLGRIMATHYQKRNFFEGIDVIVPVPLSTEREHWRGYNQSGKIAEGIAEVTHISLDTQSVVRNCNNPTQTRLSPSARQRNVWGIFTVARPECLEGKHILLVDDIITTGATLSELARTLSSSLPSSRFSILALGRGEDVLID